ncbi:hypothetical protein SAMN04490244_101317 [Tranquillimonas rosea]|uniref:Lipase (Class 3) n=1 Tax=Tranquillimonas rosea TaxID=641238 RepID=A0A1H9PSY9_9RHOB|nr:hypothetical protein [Tranquillimonas rosea]SER51220.1 hypothetical protein SAMN04490244_101317 [Tranquillimonas rosea]
MTSERDGGRVRRRRVFYLPGYDPIPPRRYRELYRREGATQAALSGYELDLQPRKGARYGWRVEGVQDGRAVTSDIEVLVWSDIVRDSMSHGIAATYAQMVRTAWIYLSTGALRRLTWLRKGPVIAALYPVGMLLGQAALAVLVGWIVVRVATRVVALTGLQAPLFGIVVACAALGAGWAVLRWCRARDGKLFAYYLMHDYAHAARDRGATPPELAARMARFTDAIAEALCADVDEVLVVGHSSGAHLAVSILADLLRQGRRPADGPALSFLSLGQVIPMISFLPEAYPLRADLRYLSARDDITWVDVTAPGDGCAFALCDPVAVSGVAPPDQRWPLVLSAAFTQTLRPETWKALRWRFFRLHFQYLCAFDRPGDYDYFRITAGPLTLGDRFAGRKPSASRITRPASGHTSRAA